ncbi:MAG: glycosyl hydrolase family 8 [Bacteroidales bacterium]|nr:glycosyl hydrolase family 8 [Bacteroidales bacterium]
MMKKIYLLGLLCTIFAINVFSQALTYNPSLFIKTEINVGNPAYPFPQFLEYKGGGKSLAKYNAEGVTHADMEKTMREAYEIMMHRCRYMGGTHCGVPYITFNHESVPGNYGTFVSEGDGYALLAAAIFADQKTFNGLYMWIHDNRFSGVKRFQDGRVLRATANDYAGPYLAGWQCDETTTSMSPSHSATDGDVDIAMAMLIAYKQWGEWMKHDGEIVKDYAGNPISLKYETQRVVGALVDTLGQWDPGSGALTGELCGVVGIDGYEKRGNSWGELTRWRFTAEANAMYPNVNGPYNGGPNLYGIYGGNYIDYDAPSYFEEFWRWLKNGDGVDENNKVMAPWEIHQFKRAAASGNWLNQQAYEQGYQASIGQVMMSEDGKPTFSVYVGGEDFRYPWRHMMDYLWHGNADYDWDPKTHQVIEGKVNRSEYDMGMRHAELLKNPTNGGKQLCSKMGASPDPGQPLWFGVSQIPQQWNLDGTVGQDYHTVYSPGAGSPAAVISGDLDLLADIYRQCELLWDGNNTAAKLDPEERYIGSTPKYFHGWFRVLGLLVCSGNLAAPEDMKPIANMKVYMSVDKTYAYEGDKVGYTVQYRNYGTLDAKDVKIQTPLDPDYTFVSATKGGVYDPATHSITWNIGTVPGFKTGGLAATQDSVAFTVRITSLENSRVCETSTITGSNFDEWVSNEYPNHATYTMERNCVDVLANRSLVLEKTANRTELNPNDVVTFTVNFENVSSDDAWMNGGRDNVRLSYGNYYMQGSAYQFYHLYRFWNDSYEAYINMSNYRLSYFMYDAAAQGLYDAAKNPTGWTFVVDNQNDLDKYGYNPETGPITFAYQKIPQGEDEFGKWNQRLMIRFADVLMAPSTHVYDKLDSQYLLHKGVWGPGFIRARLASNPYSDLSTRVQDDWSFSTDITAKTIDGQGETFTLVTPCWANYDDLGYEIDNYSRHTCSAPTSKLKNFERVLVEEFDGYTWRRIQGRGPLPGKEAYNVTIVDTIPKELSFKEFVTKKALGIEATYTAAPAGANYTGIVKWTIPEMLVGESGKLVYTCVAKDLGCPTVEDTYYINAAWIYSDTDSPDSSSVELMTTCTDLPPYIEPQTSLFKTASQTTATVGDVISYEVKYINTTGTIVDEDCSSSANWMAMGGKTLPNPSGSKFSLNTNGSSAYFFGPKYSYGENGSVYITFSGCNSTTQELYFVMRYDSGIPGTASFKGLAMKLFINKDGKNNFGYELYDNGTMVAREGTSWQDAMQFAGSNTNPTFKFVLNEDHLYMYVNDEENEWTSVMKDWKGLSKGAGYFGIYVNSNGNGATALDNFKTELDYAFNVTLYDELPSELTDIKNISGNGKLASNKITWPMVAGPVKPNEVIAYTFDATVDECNSFINNYGLADVYGQETLKVVNSVKCGATICPDAPDVVSPITYCKGQTAPSLIADGKKLKWYDADMEFLASGTGPVPSTEKVGSFTYYVTQTGSCESDPSEIVVEVIETEKPTVEDITLCKNDMNVSALTAEGEDLKWYNSDDVQLDAAPKPDVAEEGDFSFFVTQTVNECESEKAEIIVTVGALAKPTVESPVNYCQGLEAEELSATADGGVLQWYSVAINGTALASTPVPSTENVGSVSYFVSQKSGTCESERSEIVVNVKSNPVSSISATAESYCGDNSPITLSIEPKDKNFDMSSASYQWYIDGSKSGSVESISEAQAGTYSCVLSLDGCSYTTEEVTISQYENPTYTITGAGSYCPESTEKEPVVITFTSGEAPFSFTDAVLGEVVSETNVYTVENPKGGTYKISILKDAHECSMVEVGSSVTVEDLETPDLTISSIPGVCAETESVDISKYVSAGRESVSYSTDKGTVSAAGILTGLTAAGEYNVSVTVTGKVAPYCTNTKIATVTVFSLPEIAFEEELSVCADADLQINPTITTATRNYSVAWSGDAAEKLNSKTLIQPTFNASVENEEIFTLNLTVIDENKCSSKEATTVKVNPVPTVSLTMSETSFCVSESEPQTITAKISPEGIKGDYTWEAGDAVTTASSAKITPSSCLVGKNEIKYMFETESGCASEWAVQNFTVKALPEISLAPSKADICVSGENSSDVTMIPSQSVGTFEYSINKGTIETDGTFSASNGVGEYEITLTYTGTNSCQNVATTTVTVHKLPQVSFAETNPKKACYNSTLVELTVQPSVESAAAYSFIGTASSTTSDFNPSAAAVGENTMTYIYTDENGCQNSASWIINVEKVEAPSIEAPNPRTVTVEDGNLLDVTTMKAVPSVVTDNLIWQDASRIKLADGAEYTSPATTEGVYQLFVKEYRNIEGNDCYSDSTLATLVLSDCNAKSPIVTNENVCVGAGENNEVTVTLNANYAGESTGRKISWFASSDNIESQTPMVAGDDVTTWETVVNTEQADVFTFYVAEYSSDKDCWSFPTPISVIVKPLPEIAIEEFTNNGILCYFEGSYSAVGTINGVRSSAGTWSIKDDALEIGANTGVISTKSAGKTDGNYTAVYTYTDGFGCTGSGEKDFSVEYPEIPTSDGYLGIVADPKQVSISVNKTSLEKDDATVRWYGSETSTTASATGNSWSPDFDPSFVHTATYYLTQEVNGCESEKGTSLVKIVECPFEKPEPTKETVSQCVRKDGKVESLSVALPSSTTVSADSWVWFSEDDLENPLENSNVTSFDANISTDVAMKKVFYVAYYATQSPLPSCMSEKAQITVEIKPLPEIAFDENNQKTVCQDKGDVVWAVKKVNTHENGAGTGVWTLNYKQDNGMSQKGVFDPATFGEKTETYRVTYTYTDGAGCVDSVYENITVQYTPIPEVSDFSALTEQNATVIVSATPLTDDAVVTWYDANGLEKSKDKDFETADPGNVVTHKSYFATQTINSCQSQKAEAKVDIIDCPVPKPIVVQPEDICNYDNAPEITATAGNWISGERPEGTVSFRIYDSEVDGEMLSESSNGTFIPEIDNTKAAVYTYWVSEYNVNVTPSACESKRSKVSLTVKKTETPTIMLSKNSVCYGAQNPSYSAIGQGTILWYEEEPLYPATDELSMGNPYNPTYTEPGVYAVWATQKVDGCLSEAVSKEFEIIANPEVPEVQSATICAGSPKDTLRAYPLEDGIITWYENEDKTGVVSKSANFAPQDVNAGVYTYYASQTIRGCMSNVSPAEYTIVALPSAPVVTTDASACDYDEKHVLSVMEKENVSVSWYSSPELADLEFEGNVLEHVIEGSGLVRYFVRQTENGCVGPYATASFVVVEKPKQPVVTGDIICSGNIAGLYTDGSKDLWYSDEFLTQLEGQGYTLTVTDLTASKTYYVVREKNGCFSEPKEAVVEVIPQPVITITQDGEDAMLIKRCEYEDEKYISTSVFPKPTENDHIEWYIFPGNITVKDADSILLSNYVNLSASVTSSVSYTVRAQYMVKNTYKNMYCASAMDTVKYSTYAKVREPIVLSSVICQGEQIEPMFAFGTPSVTWISLDGINPPIFQGPKYEFSAQQGNLEIGSYRFKVFDINDETGCHSDTVEVALTMAPAAETKIFGRDSVCVGASESYYTKYNETSIYNWFVTGDNLNYSKDATSLSVRYIDWNTTGIDTLIVHEQTWAGCEGHDTLIVKIAEAPRAHFSWSLPGASNVIELVDSTQQDSLYGVMPDGELYAEPISYTMYWNFGHVGSNPNDIDLEVPYEKRNFPITESGYLYGYNCPSLTVKNDFGCSDSYSDCIFINISSGLYMPSAFSPLNPAHSVRYFQPKGYNLAKCEVSVYDKWGNLLWYSNEVEDGMFMGKWDGTYNGKIMKSDMYIWKMEASFIDGQIWEGYDVGNGKKVKFGNVLLLR